jgi:hypothetical protein
MQATRVAAAVGVLAAVVAAQGGYQSLDGHAFRAALPNSASAPALLTHSDWGDFDGDRRLDALLLEGATARVAFDLGVTFAFAQAPGAHTALCALRDAGAARDQLALARAAGVELWRWDGQGFAAQSSLPPAWAGAARLRAFDLDADGVNELLGVDEQRANVLVAQRSGSNWTTVLSLPIQGGARDVVALQWDGDAPLELAVLSEQSVTFFDHDGALLRVLAAPLAGGAIARLERAGQPTDRLAWVGAYAPPQVQWLRTLAPDGSFEHIELGDLGAYSASAADFDADGDSDLLLAPRLGERLLWLENLHSPGQDAPLTFDVAPWSGRVFYLRDAGDASQSAVQAAEPAVADFDGDGDFDIAVGVQHTRELMLRLGDWIDEGAQRTNVSFGYHDAQAQTVELQFDAPPSTSFVPTHWQLDVWRADSAVAASAAQAVQSAEFAGCFPSNVVVNLNEPDPLFDAVYHIRLQPVQRDAQGQLVTSGMATLFAFSVSEATAAQLLLQPGAEPQLELPSSVSASVGVRPSIRRGRRSGAFPTDDPPTPAPPVQAH